MVYNVSELARSGLIGYKDRHSITNLIKRGELEAKVVKTKKRTKYIVSNKNIEEFFRSKNVKNTK